MIIWFNILMFDMLVIFDIVYYSFYIACYFSLKCMFYMLCCRILPKSWCMQTEPHYSYLTITLKSFTLEYSTSDITGSSQKLQLNLELKLGQVFRGNWGKLHLSYLQTNTLLIKIQQLISVFIYK